MKSHFSLPAGVRLDSWSAPQPTNTPTDAPEVAALREELRTTMPQMAQVLELLNELRPALDLSGRIAGPQPVGTDVFLTLSVPKGLAGSGGRQKNGGGNIVQAQSP